jgi:hypothetical protein
MEIYEPPRQSLGGQVRDALVIVLMVFVVLFGVTFIVESDTGGAGDGAPKALSQLDITPAERQQFQKMIEVGVTDLQGVNDAVATNFPRDDKYVIDWPLLALTVGSIAAYLFIVVRISLKEYREVVRERFDALSAPREEAL